MHPPRRISLPLIRRLLLLTLALFSGTFAHAISFTFHTKADATAEGYTQGQDYSFTFMLTNSTDSSLGLFFTGAQNWWMQNPTGGPELFTGISGPMLGAYSTPPGDSYAWMFNSTNLGGWFALYAENFSGANGFTTLNGTPIDGIGATVLFFPEMLSASYPGSFVAPSTYWAGYAGTYPTSTEAYIQLHNIEVVGEATHFTTLASFHITSLTISTSTVPEGTSSGLLTGLVLAGLAWWRRRIS
jgi:MYXO-CTERM domain-containing protein